MADIERYFGFSHNPEWVSDRALSFIHESVTARSPFLLYYNPTLPHGPPAAKALAVSVRSTPNGQLAHDPVSGMPDRKVVGTFCVWNCVLCSWGGIPGRYPDNCYNMLVPECHGARWQQFRLKSPNR